MTTTLNPKLIRKTLGMNQFEFWNRIGVTQSGGSRYESGRTMPKPVRELLRLVHIEGIDLATLKREEIMVLNYLRERQPQMLKELIALAGR
ncbi:helix-turn-helix domain-containing protein [Chitinibacter sp. S2-10]|uniref:helix-turn-helix domain-containing protein n=1 Tax=Chitinibacter sp. S2-10 TaxID=3373597 RepID=UPI0039778563